MAATGNGASLFCPVGEPELGAAMEIIEAEMASQREWLAEQERLGTLPR